MHMDDQSSKVSICFNIFLLVIFNVPNSEVFILQSIKG